MSKKRRVEKGAEPALPAENGGEEGQGDWTARTVRMPPELLEFLDGDAKGSRRTTNLHIVWILENYQRDVTAGDAP